MLKHNFKLTKGFETAPFPGEEEGTFHLQRSETGDARLSRERESIRVNQQIDYNTARPIKRPSEYNKERDIFRGSSSSNFFNNKNGGKENDEDYEDHPQPNRNADIPKKKIIRKLNRKEELPTTTTTNATPRSNRPTGFVNNFAGSPLIPSTTGRTISTTSAITPEQYTTAIQNYRGRQRGRTYNNAEQYRAPTTPAYNPQPRRNEPYRTPSTQNSEQYRTQPNPTTPAYNPQPRRTSTTQRFENTRIQQSSPTQKAQYSSYKTENYPTSSAPFSKTPAKVENYPSTNYKKPTTFKSDSPTTYSPKKGQYYQKPQEYFQKNQEEKASSVTPVDYNKPKGFDFTYQQNQYSTTPRSTTQHTQYTPTVPKQSTQYFPTTQAPKLAKTFDYDDGSYNPKYNDEHYNPREEDEFLKTAHSQNFASSRNELAQSQKINLPIPTKESPRPFSATTQPPRTNPKPIQVTKNSDPKVIIGIKNGDNGNGKQEKPKKEKDNSYDYAYYDTNVGSDPEYDIVTEFSKNVKKE